MAKDKFQPSKPHVNVGSVVQRLLGQGFSAAGARDLAHGRMPIQTSDQQLLVTQFLRLAQTAGPLTRAESIGLAP